MRALDLTAFSIAMCAASIVSAAPLRLVEVGDAMDTATVEIRGVSAGAFNPSLWEANRLHWVRDVRAPLLEPREGKYRNIYAPSAVQTEDGWRLFYGGWDGAPTGNDRIYATATADFVSFNPRRTVIENGVFQHVCNVNALAARGGGYEMVCTAYPDPAGFNKPALFQVAEALTSPTASAPPHAAALANIAVVRGYEQYSQADINGMNVLLREGEHLHLYFADFRNFGRIFRAVHNEGTTFTLEGVALEGRFAPNDVKKFRTSESDWYAMGLHMNRGVLRYSLSRDGMTFEASRVLFESADDAEKFITSLGWVVSGDQEAEGRRLLGVLYGAGAVPTLDQNRIFARWLQKRVTLQPAMGSEKDAEGSLGPDRQVFRATQPFQAVARLYAEDGTTLEGESSPVRLEPGKVYEVRRE